MTDSVRILFLASDPFRDRAALRLDEEVRAIDAALRRGDARDQVELVQHFATRTTDLQHAMMRHEPHVVHFAGHGDGVGDVVLGDRDGRPHPVPGAALAGLFRVLPGRLRGVVLNGCRTLASADAVAEVVDWAVGMERPIGDDSAIDFAAAFYGALAMRTPVDTAFALGVNQLRIDSSPDADLPVLRLRPGADAGALVVADGRTPCASPDPSADNGARQRLVVGGYTFLNGGNEGDGSASDSSDAGWVFDNG